MDHVSDFICVHLMHHFTLEETHLAKAVGEKVISQAEHATKHCQANNGRLADNGFVQDTNKKEPEDYLLRSRCLG